MPSLSRPVRSLSTALNRFEFLLKTRLLPLGLFIQLTGILWIGSSGGYITQTYLWCLFPGFLALAIDLYRYGLRTCLTGMTTGEKLIGLLFLWILINPLFTTGGVEFSEVVKRVVKVALYLYVVRTVVIHYRKPEHLLLLAAAAATGFALATIIHQLFILDRPIGLRVLGVAGYRIGSLGIGDFANIENPILAALYYGSFAGILCGYCVSQPLTWKKSPLVILGIVITSLFILFSGSRGPLMALIAMGGAALLLSRFSWKRPVLAVLAVGGIGFISWQYQSIHIQLQSVIADGFNGRFVNWEMAVEYIKQKPLFGHGAYADYIGPLWGNAVLQHPHNMLLNISYMWGAPAGLLFLAAGFWALGAIWLNRKNRIMIIAGCLMVFGQVGMMTDTYSFLPRPDLQWLLFFLPLALCSVNKRKSFKRT